MIYTDQPKKCIILDQSSTRTGVAILDDQDRLDVFGDIAPAIGKAPWPLRIRSQRFQLIDLLKEYRPAEMVIEGIHYKSKTMYPSAIEPLAGGAGFCCEAAALRGIPVYRVLPQQWKACLHGAKEKALSNGQMYRRLAQRWGILESEIGNDDTRSALGIAAYWVAHRARLRREQG